MQATKGVSPSKHLIMTLGLCWIASTSLVRADTVYRCGDSYSTSAQCAQAPAHELPQHSHSHNAATDGPEQDSLARVQRDAVALEKMRLQSERQPALAAPLKPPRATHAPAPSQHELTPEQPMRHGRRRYQSPYFTAKVPSAPKEKAAPPVKSAASSTAQ